MGINLVCPIQQKPIYYLPNACFTCLGHPRSDDYSQDTTYFHQLQAKYWEDLLSERRKEQEAKRKFRSEDQETINRYLAKFPLFTPERITDLKLQFQTFDLNQDGLIDFHELMQVLDDLGDRSSKDKRVELFEAIDEDGSGAIDFEEYIGLIYQIQHENSIIGDKSITAKFGNDHLQTIRQLTLEEKIETGLF